VQIPISTQSPSKHRSQTLAKVQHAIRTRWAVGIDQLAVGASGLELPHSAVLSSGDGGYWGMEDIGGWRERTRPLSNSASSTCNTSNTHQHTDQTRPTNCTALPGNGRACGHNRLRQGTRFASVMQEPYSFPFFGQPAHELDDQTISAECDVSLHFLHVGMGLACEGACAKGRADLWSAAVRVSVYDKVVCTRWFVPSDMIICTLAYCTCTTTW
jgi:hypothetical protein